MFSGAFPTCAAPAPLRRYPAHGAVAPRLRLQSCTPLGADAWLPWGSSVRASSSPAPAHPDSPRGGAPIYGCSPPAGLLGCPPRGQAKTGSRSCVNPASSPRSVYLSKFNSPAGCIPPKPTCSLVAELWVWLVLQRFLAASGWRFAAQSLSPADAGSLEVLGKPILLLLALFLILAVQKAPQSPQGWRVSCSVISRCSFLLC